MTEQRAREVTNFLIGLRDKINNGRDVQLSIAQDQMLCDAINYIYHNVAQKNSRKEEA